VTHSLKEYEERAYSLATNRTRLEKIKKILMENKNSVSLFDTKLFVKNFEKALVKTWNVFLNNSKHETFYVKDI
jgi:protein O-GlcNAc transferase